MISRSTKSQAVPLNICGSSVFGRYPKISIEKTYNMFLSDNWLVPYAGYEIAINSSNLGDGFSGRGIFASTKLNRIIAVIDDRVYQINISFNQSTDKTYDTDIAFIGSLQTSLGDVWITENNAGQIAISDGQAIYIYDPSQSTPALRFQKPTINFTPGYITFHDTYFLCASTQDGATSPPANNAWRLSDSNNGLSWPSDAAHVGFLQTKGDNTQAVIRFPGRGNLIFVMGNYVTEPWTDVGLQLFPYQRNNSYNIDYGCLNPATIASMDEMVVWLAANEKSGAIIMYSTGGNPEKITTDGIDYLFAQLKNPADSRAFMYRQDGHLFYHINFYTDNLSLFYDFNTKRFYHASDENLNHFIADQVAFFNNQYWFLSKSNGNLYAFDTTFTTYNGAEIPRFRTCKNIRNAQQTYFIATDAGFTIETGETDYQVQDLGDTDLITQDNNFLITQGSVIFLMTEDGDFLDDQNSNELISEQIDATDFDFLISNNNALAFTTPRVDLSISYDGGYSFGTDMPYELNPVGKRANRLYWWQLGMTNDMVCLFKFWGMGRFVAYDGEVNVRQ